MQTLNPSNNLSRSRPGHGYLKQKNKRKQKQKKSAMGESQRLVCFVLLCVLLFCVCVAVTVLENFRVFGVRSWRGRGMGESGADCSFRRIFSTSQ